MLTVEGVTKKYGDFTAVEELHITFENGVYGLLAPNGAGKTTLIKMLTTLISPSNGQIRYNGQNIVDMGEAYRSLVGYLPQQFGYYKHQSPKQYLLYIAALKGMKKREALTKIDQLLQQVALTDVKNKKMKKFSGGMIQRVGIAQALLNDPKILILDEPTAGLDPKERARFRHLLTALGRERIVLISTHIVSDIESIANQIVMIKNKRLLYHDSVLAICQTLGSFVFEATIPFEELALYRERYTLLAEKQEQGNMVIRFVHKGEPLPEWVRVIPHLEDVFLYEYRDEIEADV